MDSLTIKDALTADKVAERLGITDRRVRQLARKGILPGVKYSDVWFFSPEDIEAFGSQPRKNGRPSKQK